MDDTQPHRRGSAQGSSLSPDCLGSSPGQQSSGRAPAKALGARAAILVLMLGFFAQLTFGSLALSMTSDEPPHVAHGYIMLATGDTWALSEHRHPPLLNVLAAVPLLLQPEHPDPATVPGWHQDFVVFVRNLWPLLGPINRQAFVTRVPTMLLSVALMALVARWAREAFGRTGALAAVAVMVFDPAIVAHGQLATTDLGVALFTFAAVYLVTQGRRSTARILGAGAALGAALASKGSGVLLVPVIFALLAWRRATQHDNRLSAVEALQGWARDCGLVLLVSFAVLWATYGFRLEPSPWGNLRLPLVAHAKMVSLILSEKQRTAFLLGEVRQGGWWWYFPFALAVKTPLPLLALFVGAGVAWLARPRRLLAMPGLWLYPLVHFGTSALSGMNIGYRHLLPIFPFGYVAIAALVQQVMARSAGPRASRPHAHAYGRRTAATSALSLPGAERARRPRSEPRLAVLAVIALISWQAVETATVFPFGLAYFNELVGGPREGYRALVDSNVDWGQSFKALATWMRGEGIDHVSLSYYTWIDPAAYGIDYTPLPPAGGESATFPRPFDPAPGVYVISATPLEGVMVANPDLYAWFREREPTAQPGYGLLVYDVAPSATEPAWVAQCTQPVAPLTQQALAEGFGRTDLRQIGFDCTGGWIQPTGGNEVGWYVVHRALSEDSFVERELAGGGATLSYRQREPGLLPPFDIYAQPATMGQPEVVLPVPIPFGPVTLLGYTASSPAVTPGETLDVETWWQVKELPDRPLSLMLHLGAPGEAPIAVGDGLAVPTEMWRADDVIIQRHVLQIPPGVAPGDATVVAGVYWLDTLERWPVTGGPQTGATGVALTDVSIGR